MFRNPVPTADCVIEVATPAGPAVVLIQRGHAPLGWALPGGFLEEGETAEEGARREALEETGLHVELLDLLYVYSRPERDTRRHTLSIVFCARAEGDPRGMDDAADARLFSLPELRALADGGPGPDGRPLAFDHAGILADWLSLREEGRRPGPRDGRRR